MGTKPVSTNPLTSGVHDMDIDWINAGSTLVAAAIGGAIAARVATFQTRATFAAEQASRTQQTARDLLEAIDSYIHIAYRGDREERQRCERRVLTLSALVTPARFDAIQDHFELVNKWHQWKTNSGPKPHGIGLSATETFFEDVKQALFRTIFGVQLKSSDRGPETDEDIS